MAALRLLPLALPEARLWSVDAFRYLDPLVIVLTSLLLLACALPPVQQRLAEWFGGMDSKKWARVTGMFAGFLLLAALLFPMRTFFFGDGGTLISEVYKINALENYTSSVLLNLKSAPLAGGMLHALAVSIPASMIALGMTPPESPMFPFYALSLLGVAALYVVLFFERDSRHRFLDIAFIVGSGAVVLLFSHVEMYLSVTLAITAFLLAGQRALKGEVSAAVVILLFVVSVLAHYMALALLPALLFVLGKRSGLISNLTGSARALFLTWLASLVLIVVLYWLLGFAASDSRIVMPLFDVSTDAGTQSYTLLSVAHLMDIGNVLLLLGALPLLFVITNTFTQPRTASTQEQRFLWTALLYFGTFIFFANTSLGLARDWDIAAPLGIMFALLARHSFASAEGGARRAIVGVAALASVAAVIPWVLVNVDDDAAALRFEEVMQLDESSMYGDYALSGYEALRKHYIHNGQLDKEALIIYRMIDRVGYAEQYRLMLVNSIARFTIDKKASMQSQLWMLDRLQRTADELILSGKDRNYSISRWEIDSLVAVIAVESITNATMREVFVPVRDMKHRAGLKLGHDILVGAGWYLDQKFPEAAEALRSVWESRFRDARVDGMYGSALSLSGMPDVGDAVFMEASQWHREHPQFLFFFAITQLQLNRNLGAAKTALEFALTSNPPEAVRSQISEILQSVTSVQSSPLPWER